jgi:hypothetical protein
LAFSSFCWMSSLNSCSSASEYLFFSAMIISSLVC